MTKMMWAMLRAGIFSGAVALLPAVALAGSGSESAEASTAGLVDHTTVEARGAGAVTESDTAHTTVAVPDHETAEARGAVDQAGR